MRCAAPWGWVGREGGGELTCGAGVVEQTSQECCPKGLVKDEVGQTGDGEEGSAGGVGQGSSGGQVWGPRDWWAGTRVDLHIPDAVCMRRWRDGAGEGCV